EFLMAINITAKGNPEKKLKWAFKMYDIDSNGSIDRQEMLKIIESIYDLLGAGVPQGEKVNQTDTPESRTAQIFDVMVGRLKDEDKNGVITEEEFIRGCMADRVLYQMLTADTSDPDR
ncbi:unnamed protein product, partial [Didymodactylos carnosus]